MIRKHTTFVGEQNLVITELSGELDNNDVAEWHQSLTAALAMLKPETKFKILVDLHGFKANNIETHKKFRGVVPNTLAEYGWYVGYLRMFPEATVTVRSSQHIYCMAAAHVHHDETKIQNYADNYSMRNERFFTDPVAAKEWISNIPPGS